MQDRLSKYRNTFVFRSTLIGTLSHGLTAACNPEDKYPDYYVRLNGEVTNWIREKTLDSKPKTSNCNDI